MSSPKCKDTRKCFARVDGRCVILTDALQDCPFAKPNRFYTGGKYYPYEEMYADRKKTLSAVDGEDQGGTEAADDVQPGGG